MSSMSSEAAGGAASSEKEEQKRRAMLEEQVQMRLEIDSKALQIVERLLDNPITEDFLVDCAKFIVAQHYKDVVEERSILKQCGYPLCQRSLPNVPKQKYHISRKTNQVYDITERKNFCRQFCYKASKFYEAQLSDSPLWARDLEGPLEIKLLTEEMETDSKVATLIAKDHVLLTERIQSEDINTLGKSKIDQPLKEEAIGLLADDLSSMTFAGTRRRERLQELEEISGSHTSQDEPRTIVNLIEESSKDNWKDRSEITKGTRKVIVKDSESQTQQTQNPEDSMMVDVQSASPNYQAESSLKMTQGESKKKTKKKSKKTHQNTMKDISLLDVVGKTVTEWKTASTLAFLHGRNPSVLENPASREVEKAACGNVPAVSDPSCPPAEMSGPPCPPVKPLPGMECLKEETQNYELKVQEFYYGKSVEVKKEKDKKSGTGDIQEKDEVDRKIRLPLIDSKSQMSIRRRIVSDRLKREYCEILVPMRLSLRDISSDLQALLCTFRLSSHNITFKPASWTMLAILLLTILAQHNQSIRDSLTNDANRGFLEILLAKMDTSMEKLYEVISNITASNP